MGSTPFDLHRKAPEEKRKKKRFSLKLPVGKVLVGGLLLGSCALYTGLNTYTVGENEAVYSVNNLKPSNRVSIDRSEGLNLPFVDTALHLPWPLGGSDSAAPWPFGSHAVVPLSGDFSGTIQTQMYNTRIERLSYSIPEDSQDAFLLRYGPFAFGENLMERAVVENEDFSFQGIVDAVTEDEEGVNGATQALFSDINTAVAFVLRGRSVEEINAMKDDQIFMSYLTNEVERLLGGLVDIEDFDIGTVTRAQGVITFTTADGFPVDVLVSYGGSSFGRSGSTAIDPVVVQGVLGKYYLMEYRTGQLPPYIRDELTTALGASAPASQQPDATSYWSSRLEGYGSVSSTTGSRTLIVNLGNAQDLFYRTFFNSGMIAFENDVAADRVDAGDIEGAIEMYEGVVEYSHLFPLNDSARADVADAMVSLGFLYEDLSAMAYNDSAYDAAQEFLGRAASNFADFVRIAPASHPQRNAVMQHLYMNYGEFLDSSSFKINEGAEADLEHWYGPLPEGTQPTPTPQATPEATPTPSE